MTSNVNHELKFFIIFIPALIVLTILLWIIVPLLPINEIEYHVDEPTIEMVDAEQEFTGEPDLTGYVVGKDKEKGRILVVDPNPNKTSYYSLWGTFPPRYVKVGEEVKVWIYGQILDSNPPQAMIGKLEIIPSAHTKNADLTETEALNIALTTKSFARDVLYIDDIQYIPNQDLWKIRIRTDRQGDAKSIQIKDS